jgi:hypothetical protein
MREYQYEVWAGWKFTRQFPEDMLRYDQAHIVGQHQAGDRMVYVIQGKRKPTVGRWKSFMWEVGPVTPVKS